MNPQLDKCDRNHRQPVIEHLHQSFDSMQKRKHSEPSVRNGNQINQNIAGKRQENDMKHTPDKLLNMAMEKDGNGSAQLPGDIRC